MSTRQTTPFFSIVVPTKNRSWLIRHLLRSLALQSFQDYEVIVADNDDTDATAKVVAEFDNGRVRYCRTGGLSMCDNWEFAISQATGEYVLVIEDKIALKTTALVRLHDVIAAMQCRCISWLGDSFADNRDECCVVRIARTSGKVYNVASERILETITRDWESPWMRAFPNGARTAVHRDVLADFRDGPFKRIFVPTNPDYNMAYMLLHNQDRIAYLDRSLMMETTCKVGNGRSTWVDGAEFEDFMARSGPRKQCYDSVPIKTHTLYNSIFNDYARARQLLGGRLQDYDLYPPEYLRTCRKEILKRATKGFDMSEERQAWSAVYESLSPDMKAATDGRLNNEGGRSLAKRFGKQWTKLMQRVRSPESVWRAATSCDQITSGWDRIRVVSRDPIDYLKWERELEESSQVVLLTIEDVA